MLTLWKGEFLLKKKRVAFFVIPIFIVAVIVVKFTLFTPYRSIERYVNQNKTNLTFSSEFYLEEGTVNKANNDTVDVDGIFGDTNRIVQFHYSGFGIAPSSTYYGFYYSPSDVPVPYCNEDYELTMDVDGGWTWNGDGDNGGKIKKISDNWYYYEAWF